MEAKSGGEVWMDAQQYGLLTSDDKKAIAVVIETYEKAIANADQVYDIAVAEAKKIMKETIADITAGKFGAAT